MQPRHSRERVSSMKENQEAPSQLEAAESQSGCCGGFFCSRELMNDTDDSECSCQDSQRSPVSEMAYYTAKTPRAKGPTLATLHLGT